MQIEIYIYIYIESIGHSQWLPDHNSPPCVMTEIVIFFSMLSGSNYMVWNRYGHSQIPPP